MSYRANIDTAIGFITEATPNINNISVVTDDCSILNSWNLSGNTLTVNKSANISGSVIGGNVYFNGDSTGGSGTIENLYILFIMHSPCLYLIF